MIVSGTEVEEVRAILESVVELRSEIESAESIDDFERAFKLEHEALPEAEDRVLQLVNDRPHLLLPLGFDEFHAIPCEYGAPLLPRSRVPHVEFASFDFEQETFFRRPSGAWSWFEGITTYRQGEGPTSEVGWYVHTVDNPAIHSWTPLEAWVDTLAREAKQPRAGTSTLLLPALWTPAAIGTRDLELTATVSGILQGFQGESVDLRSISWRDLEELVAELLRARGLDVYVTPRAADGGRDIVARGELIPGEPTTLAVEVKQKPLVRIEELRAALYANRHFPIVMMATAGRFSAGVLREKGVKRTRCD